ncbi:MAG: oxidoreductase [Peptococcaceae bacterium BICA1-7]|nr:MAG: oxidoreductase [Peptococcaceae bacterium BICA1-7]
MKALVVGYGSIGARHARILTDLGCRVSVVSGREIDFNFSYKSIKGAFQGERPQYIVIANGTADHFSALQQLIELDHRGVVLVEKPLFNLNREIPDNNFSGLFIGYNLRFHPIIKKLYRILQTEKVISAHVYVGQYLPSWRPSSDYRQSYSADKMAGGGVLRDLSHEMDYLNWMLGGWRSMVSMGGKLSSLEIESEDVFSIMMVTEKCQIVTLQLNYLDRISQREIIINTDNHTVKADLVNGILNVDRKSDFFEVERDFTYRAQHKALIEGDLEYVCTDREGIEVIKMIQAAEKSSELKEWVKNV